ncbi:hydrogenase maturation protease [Enterovibrio sp. ZSDZ35]|uniref:Hydrogenase maturation protease n=1 Tax=Enterovibrio qingdaonensis TaxID=2899818 RepID=A0ABT5QI86_9GAMM|nr:hydrogenase maturation protease [Enterovibrio sp. ZSDZ35]MDD1780697.1 hydrogenase maturation protease [Enterovibrio sp. ZSDZ35]
MIGLRILCFGNTLHSDDGIGAAVALRLREQMLPKEVEVHDVGLLGLNALPLFKQTMSVLVVDAADVGLSPGHFKFLSPEQLNHVDVADHMGGVGYLLQAVNALITPLPQLDVFAIQPAVCKSFSPVLSKEAESSLDAVVEAIIDYANNKILRQNVSTHRQVL